MGWERTHCEEKEIKGGETRKIEKKRGRDGGRKDVGGTNTMFDNSRGL